jgi:translocation and assembly module TamB
MLAAMLGAALLCGLPGRAQTPEDQGVLAGFVSRLLSTPTSRVTIGAVEGALSSNATIRDVSVADEAGVYLRIDRIGLVWRRTALLQRRIEIERLDIGRVELMRRPGAAGGDPEPGPILPELPLSLQVGAFRLGELVLGEPVLGTPTRLGATGSASLGAPAQGLRATLAINRLDAAGAANLDLAFVPETSRLDLNLRLDEPAGGILARLAGIPGTPPVRLDLTGTGVLDDWQARLNFAGGPDLGAEGQARLARSGAERVLTLNLTSRITPLLPLIVAPVFAGNTDLAGAIAFGDGGDATLRDLRLTSALAELVVAGTVAQDRQLALSARARATPNAGSATKVADTTLERLVFEGSLNGPFQAPRVQGSLDIAGFASPDLSLDRLTTRFSATPRNSSPNPPALNPTATGQRPPLALDFEVRGSASAVALADPGLSAALGRDIEMTLLGSVDAGTATFETARIASPTVALDYAGRLGSTLVDGRLAARILKLDAFSRLAGRPLAGRGLVEARLSGNPRRDPVRAEISGEGTMLAFGDAALNRLIGPTLTLDGTANIGNGSVTLDALRLKGGTLEARLDGRLAAENLDLTAALDLADLRRADTRLQGRGTARLRLTGATADPTVALRLEASEARALDRPIRDFVLTLDARQPLSAPDLTLRASGTIGGNPLDLNARVQGTNAADNRAWTIERLVGRLGSVTLEGGGRISGDGLAEGRVALRAGDLDHLSPLVLRRLGGRLDATITASVGDGRQRIALAGTGSGIVADAIRLAGFTADLSLDDAYRSPTLRGEARLTGLVAGGQTFEVLSLNATDAGQGESGVTLAGRASGFVLNGEARLIPGPPTRVRLATFRATRNGRSLALAQPATLDIADGGIRTEGLELDIAGGRLSLSGRFGQELDATVALRALPLAAADIGVPGSGLAGTADGRARLTGPVSAPQGPFELSLRGVSLPVTRESGLPPLDLTAMGSLDAGSVRIDATLRGAGSGARGIDLTLAGRAALAETGPVDLAIRGTLDAALANARLAGGGQRVAGRLAIDSRVEGTRRDPRLRGSASLSGASFIDAAQGIAITGIEGRFTGQGETIAIERLTGRTVGGANAASANQSAGTLSVLGRITIDPARGFPADLKITGRGAQLVDSSLARLVADLDLALTGPLATAPRLAGRIGVRALDVRVPERFGGAGSPLRDARHVAPPPQTRARLAQIARASAGRGRGAPPFRAALDVTIDAPGRIFLRGRGLDAELGGTLRLTGTTAAPIATGGFDLRRGRLTLLTQRLDFSRGRVTFGGAGLIPELDLQAETRAADVTARVSVTGPADAPTFTFSSSPDLPEDEVLSRLLFARAAGGLSPFQAIQLAQAAAQLSGAGGTDAFEATRRALGVDDLDFNVGQGGPTIGLSRAISNRIRVVVRAGTSAETSTLGVDIDLTRRLRLQTEAGADGRASVGIGIEREY